MKRSSAILKTLVIMMLGSGCAVEQKKLSYNALVPRTNVQDGICEYRVDGNLRDFIRPYLTLEIRRHGPSPQPSLTGWVSLVKPDGEEAVKAPLQLLWISSSGDKNHPDQMKDRYGTRLELGLARHPKTIWEKSGAPDTAEPLSASIYLHTPSGLEDEMAQVAIDGRMYRSDVRHWNIAREDRNDTFTKKGRLVYDPETRHKPEPEKKG